MNNSITTQPQFRAVTLQLTPAALLFLNGITKGIPHLTIYNDLLFSMATVEGTFNKRGIDVLLKPKEVEASANGLGDKWNLGRKVMTRLLKEMEELGLLKPTSNTPSKLTSISTMSAVIDWLPVIENASNEPSDETSADHQNDELPQSSETDVTTISNEGEANSSESTSTHQCDDDLSSQPSPTITEDVTTPSESNPKQSSHTYYNKQTNQESASLFDDV